MGTYLDKKGVEKVWQATKSAIEYSVKDKADIEDLSNVVGEEVINSPLLEEIEEITRETLKKDLFIDLWNKACGSYGKYNQGTDYFELNGLTDITYDDALRIYPYLVTCFDLTSHEFEGVNVRTMTVWVPEEVSYDVNRLFYLSQNLETVRFSVYTKPNGPYPVRLKSLNLTFTYVRSLHSIYGDISLSQANAVNCFVGCGNLKNFTFKELSANITFSNCPLITYDSFSYLVKNATNKNSITITVHPSVYSALQGEAEYPFNEGTQEEWTQLVQDATAKNITFATV